MLKAHSCQIAFLTATFVTSLTHHPTIPHMGSDHHPGATLLPANDRQRLHSLRRVSTLILKQGDFGGGVPRTQLSLSCLALLLTVGCLVITEKGTI